jgi:hypothetical protein
MPWWRGESRFTAKALCVMTRNCLAAGVAERFALARHDVATPLVDACIGVSGSGGYLPVAVDQVGRICRNQRLGFIGLTLLLVSFTCLRAAIWRECLTPRLR